MADTLISLLPEVVQTTYFQLNPLNPNNTEDNYQELLRINLERLSYHVYSEVSVQKETLDIYGGRVKLKNKTERYDLVLDPQETLIELKNLVDIDDYSVHQMLSYMDHSTYRYGVLINFGKANKKHEYRCSFRVYKKGSPLCFNDSFGTTYKRYTYTKTHEFRSENYWDLVSSGLVTDALVADSLAVEADALAVEADSLAVEADSLEHVAAGAEGHEVRGVVGTTSL